MSPHQHTTATVRVSHRGSSSIRVIRQVACLCAVSMLLGATMVAAQSGTPAPDAAAGITLPKQAGRVSLSPRDAVYPATLVASGVQGEVTILASVNGDGVVTDATVHETSRSSELDTIALGIVRKSTIPGAKSGLTALQQMVLVPVDFRKDAAADIATKTCADFNVDVAYFKATFPELPASKMTVFHLATGIKFLTVAPAQQVALAKRLNGAIDDTIKTCAKEPDRIYFDVFGESLTQNVKSS